MAVSTMVSCSAIIKQTASCCAINRIAPLPALAMNQQKLSGIASRWDNLANVESLCITPAKFVRPDRDQRNSHALPTSRALSSSLATRAKIITSSPTISAGSQICAESATLRKFWPNAARPYVERRNLSLKSNWMHTPNRLYDTHVPTSSAEKLVLSLNAAFTAIFDPHRGDMVAAMGETTPMITSILEHLYNRMARDISGRELLRLKPRFLDLLKTNPDARPPVKYIDDEKLVYVMQRYRETHDFTHTLLQMKPNMLGEVTVKYFEAIQLGLPMCVSAAIFGGVRLGKNHRRQLLERNLPWVVEQAQKARFLLALDWENRFEQSITELQRECSITPFISVPAT